MLEQGSLLGERQWYALIAASPRPESGEAVNVAMVFGNGRAYRLEYLPKLPRLTCLVPREELKTYEAILEQCATRVTRGVDAMQLRGMLGPQFAVRAERTLYAELSDDLIRRLKRRFLAGPVSDRDHGEDAIIRVSGRRLDRAIAATRFPPAMVASKVRPNALYADKIERFVQDHPVPRLARALRGFGRDVLVDSVAIEPRFQPRDIREVAARIGQAFWTYDRYLRRIIRERANAEVRTVGILYPIHDGASNALIDLHAYIRESWQRDNAEVIEGTDDEIVTQLAERAAWVRSQS